MLGHHLPHLVAHSPVGRMPGGLGSNRRGVCHCWENFGYDLQVLYSVVQDETVTGEVEVMRNCAAPNILPVLRKSPGEDVQRNIPSATFGNHMKNAG
jgi:hypothetical protein